MPDIIDKLQQQPRKKLLAGAVGSVLLLVFLFYYFAISALASGIEETESEVSNLKTSVIDLRSKLRKIDKLKKLKVKLEEKISLAEKELPQKEEMPKLLSTLSGLARSSGLDIKLWKSEQEIFQEYYVELPVSVQVRGGFHQVAAFFDEVGRLDRIVNVTDISMHEPEIKSSKDVKVLTQCTVTTFRQLTEQEKEARKDDKKKKQKRR